MSFDSYNNRIRKFSKLTKEEERELFRKYSETGEQKYKDEIFNRCLRYVAFFARHRDGYNIDIMDLIQEGNIALLKAIDKFDYTSGVRFISFARKSIQKAMWDHINTFQKTVKFATTHDRIKIVTHASKFLDVDDTVMAESLGVQLSDIVEFRKWELSETEIHEYQDVLEFHDNTIEEINHQQLLTKINHAVECLPERDRDIIKVRYLTDCTPTFKELAEQYGVKLQRIDQIEKRGLKKLREQLEEIC